MSKARPDVPKPKARVLALDDINIIEGFNYRAVSQEQVERIAEAIRKEGLINAVSVVKELDGTYSLIAGHHRYLAVRLLGWKTVKVSVYPASMTLAQRQAISFYENTFRVDPNPVEEAVAVLRMFPSLRITRIDLPDAAKALGKTMNWIRIRLDIATFPEKVRDMFASGRLGTNTVQALARAQRNEGDEGVDKLAMAIVKAEAAGKRLTEVQDSTGKTISRGRKRPTQTKIMEKVLTMLEAAVIGIGPRMGAYCAGMISEAEIDEDIKQIKPISKVKNA